MALTASVSVNSFGLATLHTDCVSRESHFQELLSMCVSRRGVSDAVPG